MLISLVTPALNSARFIAAAIESATPPAEVHLEHVIADGGSTDGTLDILAGYPRLIVDSRPDTGIYDAINRAMRLATGDVIGILNSDDLLTPETLLEIRAAFSSDPALDLFSGAFDFIDTAGTAQSPPLIPNRAPHPMGIAFGIPAICGRFYSRRLLEKLGPFELRLRLAADRLWIMRAASLAPKSAWSASVLYRYRMHEGSATISGNPQAARQMREEHVAMCAMLLDSRDPELTDAASLFGCWESFKLAIGRDHQRSRLATLAALVKDDPLLPLRLPRAVIEWRRRRGQHSDR